MSARESGARGPQSRAASADTDSVTTARPPHSEDIAGLSRHRWALDNAGCPALVERLQRRAVALTDAQVEAILAALEARAEARRAWGQP